MPAYGNETLPEYLGGDFGIPGAVAPEKNKQLADIMRNRLKAAQTFEQDSAGHVNQLVSDYNKSANRQLKESINQTREDFNKRGLLRSGARMGREAGQQAQSFADRAAYRYGVNENMLNTKNAIEQGAINSGLLYAGNAPGLGSSALGGAQSYVNNDISNMQAAGELFGGIGKGIGTLAGSIYSNTRRS